MSSFVLKIIAIITMLCDHASDAIYGYLSVFNIIGRIAFPIFAFQLAIGYKNTSNLKKYALRLVYFAFISQVPFSVLIYILNDTFFSLNIFFTLALGLLAIFIYDKVSDKVLKYSSITLILVIAELLRVDYRAWGVFLILFIYLFCPSINKDVSKKRNIINHFVFILGFLALCFIRFYSQMATLPINWWLPLVLFTFLPFIFMLLYNGKKGPSLKYFFYIFYPLHLLILDYISLMFFN